MGIFKNIFRECGDVDDGNGELSPITPFDKIEITDEDIKRGKKVVKVPNGKGGMSDFEITFKNKK